MLGNLLAPEIEELLRAKQYRALREMLVELGPADLGDIIADLEEKTDMVVVFRLLPKDKAAEVFEYLDFPQQEHLLKSLKSDRVRQLLEEMAPDDRTAFLEELPAKAATQFLSLLSPQERRVATALLTYPEESVGRLMTTDFVYLYPEMTVAEALEKVRTLAIDRETVYELYVTDPQRTLLGRISLRRLVISPLDSVIKDLMREEAPHLVADMDREEAVEQIKHYDLLALPVLDRSGKLVGIVTFDDLIDVLEAEHTEDAQLQAAILPDKKGYLDETVLGLVRRRLFWLVLLLGTEMVGAIVLKSYAAGLDTFIALAFFLPMMIATGGNTGTQSAALVIRALATGELEVRDGVRVIGRDLLVGLLMAGLLGVLAGILCFTLERDPWVSLCIGSGLAVIVTLSNLAGTLLPLLFQKLKMDPALMSGPFIATLVDVFGLVVYLEISLTILHTVGKT